MTIKRILSTTCFALTIFGLVPSAYSAEPNFCSVSKFKEHEVSPTNQDASRLRVFKIGKLTLAGMAIGDSSEQSVQAVAQQYSRSSTGEGYCTWYLNEGNSQAEKEFNWHSLPKPSGSNYDQTADEWMSLIGDQFDQTNVSFVSCAANRGYIAVGCNGQKHRGPTAFAMILAYAGCSPAHAAEIANDLWGNNGIKTEMRTALAQRAAALADLHPEQAHILRALVAETPTP